MNAPLNVLQEALTLIYADLGLEAQQYFDRYYLDHGIRTASQLIRIRKNNLNDFEIPLKTTIHFTPRDIGTLGITDEDPLLINAGQRIVSEVVTEYSGPTIGNPVKLPRVTAPEIRSYIAANKRFKGIIGGRTLLATPSIPHIVSYSSIDETYRFRVIQGMDLFRRYNYFSTVVNKVIASYNETAREQVIQLDAEIVPLPVAKLREIEAKWLANRDKAVPLDVTWRRMLDSDSRFVLFQLWLWAGVNRELSIFNQIPEHVLDHVSLMYVTGENYTTLNLGRFNRWIKTKENPKGLLLQANAQKTIVRFYMSLQQQNTVMEDVDLVDLDSVTDASKDGVVDPELLKAIEHTQSVLKNGVDDPYLQLDVDTRNLKGSIDIGVKTRSIEQPLDKRLVQNNEDQEQSGLSDALNTVMGMELDKDLAQLDVVYAQNEVDELTNVARVYREYTPPEQSLTSVIDRSADKLAGAGLVSAAEVARIKNLARRYEKLESPYDPKQTLAEFIEIKPELLKIEPVVKLTDKKLDAVPDESMMSYSIKDFDTRYIRDVLSKDIMNAVMHVQNAGVAVTDVQPLRIKEDYLGASYVLAVQLTPVRGSPSTVHIEIPIMDKNGIFMSSGVKYRMKKQRRDAPIRKVSDRSVALTSEISKMFVSRTERVAFDYGRWLVTQLNLKGMDNASEISDLVYNTVFYRDVKLPRSYCAVAKSIASFKKGGVFLNFDYGRVESLFTEELRLKVDSTKYVLVGYEKQLEADRAIVMGMDDNVYYFIPSTGQYQLVGSLPSFLDLDRGKEPVDYAEVRVLGYDIPVGVLLAHRIGLGNLLVTSKVKYETYPRGSRHRTIGEDEFAIYFEDEVLVFKRSDPTACLLFNGFNRFKTQLRKLSRYSFDKPEGFIPLFNALTVPLRHTVNYDLMFNSWIDHITRDLLIEMNEPTDLVLLFLSAIDKLKDDQYRDPNGVAESVICGYQRISGMVYSELFKAVRTYARNPSKNAKVEMNPKAVWYALIQDQTVSPIEESNPIHAIKEKEVVVFRGAGGRSAQSMTAAHRQFGKDSIGIISEANVDNGSVGTITYLTADPNITSLRGTCKPLEDLSNPPATKLQSTAMLLSPGSDTDDSKRVTFTSVMFTSTTFLYDSVPNRVQTGAERTVAYRAESPTWAVPAKAKGSVLSIKGDAFTVEYEDKSLETFKIGKYFGTWSGTTIPHEIVPNIAVGQPFDVGDILTYNKHYFQPDPFNEKHVVFKRGIRGNVVLWEANTTLEDACEISTAFSRRLDTGVTEQRSVKIPFDHSVDGLLKLGDHVDPESILCNLRPPLSGYGNHWRSEARQALDVVNTNTPKARYHGVIEKIEVLYTGDVEKMHPSLQEIVMRSDAKLYRENKALGIPVKSAQVDPSYRIDNTDIGEDQVVLIYYITERVGASNGDKVVLGNQLKSIVSNVIREPHVAQDGTVIDISFSRTSIANRIVNSMDLICTTNSVLALIEQEAIAAWLNKPALNTKTKV